MSQDLQDLEAEFAALEDQNAAHAVAHVEPDECVDGADGKDEQPDERAVVKQEARSVKPALQMAKRRGSVKLQVAAEAEQAPVTALDDVPEQPDKEGTVTVQVKAPTKPPALPVPVPKPLAKPSLASKPSLTTKPKHATKGGDVGSSSDAAKPASKKGKQDAQDKKPRAKSAYQFFCDAKRAVAKDELPADANGFNDVSKKLGEMWKAISAEDKAEFESKAEQDKEAKAEAIAQWDAAHPKKASKAAAQPVSAGTVVKQKPRARVLSAYKLFCAAERASVERDNPDAGSDQIKQLLDHAWQSLGDTEREPFETQAKALRDAELARLERLMMEEGELEDGSDEDEGQPAAKRRSSTKRSKKRGVTGGGESEEQPKAKRTRGSKRSKQQPKAGSAAAGEPACSDESEDDEWGWDNKERAGMILSHSHDGKFVVTCVGKAFDDVGLVDASQVKQQRSAGANPACPVSLSMLGEYEAFQQRFKAELLDRVHPRKGHLDLDDLPPGSALETCFLLGKLQEGSHILSKADPKFGTGDKMIRLPAMALSFVTQRMIDAERHKMAEVEERLVRAEELLKANGIKVPE